MTSQSVGDVVIDTIQSCDQQSGYFTQDPGKHGYFTSKTGSSRTSEDSANYMMS